MDELFRKAGDLYPLKTSESDWDSVLGRLKEEKYGDQKAVADLSAGKNKNMRRWFLLLLFIPLGFGSLIYFSGTKKNGIPTSNPISDLPSPSSANRGTKSGNLKSKEAVIADPNSESKNSESGSTAVYSEKNAKHPISLITVPQNPGQHEKSSGHIGITPIPDQTLSTKQRAADFKLSDPGPVHEPSAKALSSSVLNLNGSVLVAAMTLKTKKTPEIMLTPQTTAATGKPAPGKIQSSKGFYIGFLAGPDLSSVDFQSIKQPGFSLGLIAGYRINHRFSVETGVLWDKKYYYSTGSYFNKSNTSIPPSETIQSLNGYCNMFEIPLLLRYDFAVKNNHGFYAKAGFSSYLMKKEYYDINAIYNGGNVSYPYSYDNSTKNILSIFQLSAGYEYNISQQTKMQIEPYIKIPLQGIGIGEMPISSVGLYLGISHSFR